jgi:uncharacterized protein
LDVKPVTVVEDSDTQIVLWLPLDTPSKRPILLNHIPGTPRRWIDGQWRLEDSVWRWSELLIIIKPNQHRATWIRWSREREFQGSYINLQSRLVRTRLDFDFRDHQLDILVDPNREWRWKDEDELNICVEDGRFTHQQAQSIREEGLLGIKDIEQALTPFSESWEDWFPDETLSHPTLPTDWNDLSMYTAEKNGTPQSKDIKI